MGFYFTETIIRTGIFIICAQVLVHFRPRSSYEKYLKMLVSAMILMQLFLPVSNMFTGEGEKGLAMRIEWFQEQLERGMEQMAADYAEGETLLEQMTLEEIRKHAENKAESMEQYENELTHINAIDEIQINSDKIQIN